MGPPHESNFGYAYAKRMLDVQSRAYNKQHGTNFMCAIPNNIFGKHDLFDIENGHVVPSIIRKIWEAKHKREDVVLWGDGGALREFTFSDDVARALLFLLWSVDSLNGPVNIGETKEYSIKEIAYKIKILLDYNGKIIWDTTKPTGQLRKPSDNSQFIKLGFSKESYIDIDIGLKDTCEWFKMNYPNIRLK
jgi:GDP-L-fucose synthase